MISTSQRPSGLATSPVTALRSRLLSEIPGVRHGVTSRVQGLGLADANVGLGAPRDAADAWQMRRLWCAGMQLDAERLVTVRQVHGAKVIRARSEDAGRGARPESEPLGIGDALITAEPGVVLMTLHADCLPILLCDPVVRAVAVIHAGWRGTVAGVGAATVRALNHEFGALPDRLIAYLGPANRVCCYEVGDDVAECWRGVDGVDEAEALLRSGERWRFDVVAANRWMLVGAGVRPENIECAAICTQCGEDRWFSHRAQGPTTGRFGALISLTE